MEIMVIHQESDQTYGSPRIHRVLRARGMRCSEKRVARLMRLHGVRAGAAQALQGHDGLAA